MYTRLSVNRRAYFLQKYRDTNGRGIGLDMALLMDLLSGVIMFGDASESNFNTTGRRHFNCQPSVSFCVMRKSNHQSRANTSPAMCPEDMSPTQCHLPLREITTQFNSKPILQCKTHYMTGKLTRNKYVMQSSVHMICLATAQEIT